MKYMKYMTALPFSAAGLAGVAFGFIGTCFSASAMAELIRYTGGPAKPHWRHGSGPAEVISVVIRIRVTISRIHDTDKWLRDPSCTNRGLDGLRRSVAPGHHIQAVQGNVCHQPREMETGQGRLLYGL